MTRWGSFAATVVVLVAMALYSATHFATTTEILPFFAGSADEESSSIVRDLAVSPGSRRAILSVGSAGGEAKAILAAERLEARLRGAPGIAWVRGGVDETLGKATYDLYFPRRWLFASPAPETELPPLLSADGDGLAERAVRLKLELTLPSGLIVRRFAPEDPWLTFPAILERLEAARGTRLGTVGGRFVAQDGQAILLVGLADPALDAAAQRRLEETIARARDAVSVELGEPFTLEQSSVGRFAVEVEQTIRKDIQRIGLLSTILVVGLLVMAFGSFRAVALTALPVLAAFVSAIFACLVAFGSIHGLTLAFGGTLVGVAVDYPVHYLTHHSLAPGGRTPPFTMRRLWPELAVASATTVGGIAALGASSFPGLREVAVFAAVAVIAAVAATRWLLPPLLPMSGGAGRVQRGLAAGSARALAAAKRHPAVLLAAGLIAVAVVGVGLPRVTWLDALSSLQPTSPALQAEDGRVRARVGAADAGRFVVTTGADLEEALRRNDAAFERLHRAMRDRLLTHFDSLHPFLWSKELQERNRARILAEPGLARRTLDALGREGFDTEGFAPFTRALADLPTVRPLDLDTLRASPLAPLVEPFVAKVGGRPAVLTFLQGVTSAAELEKRLADLPGTRYFDTKATLDGAFRSYRERTQELLTIGLALVFVVLLFRYRRVGPALSAFVPALLAGATALSILSLLGVALHLLHVLSLLLVLSMGVDYGVFVLEEEAGGSEPGSGLTSVLVACLTTVFSFGVLSLSGVPALAAIGQTTALGTLLCVLLVPAGVVLGRRWSVGKVR